MEYEDLDNFESPCLARYSVIISAEDHTGRFQLPLTVRIFGRETVEQAIVRTMTGKLELYKSFVDICFERNWKNGRFELSGYAKAI